MNCEQCRENLSGYHDRELDASCRDEVEGHLESCPECRNQLQALESLSGSIARVERYSISPDRQRQLLPARPPNRPVLQLRWFLSGAALVAGLWIFSLWLPSLMHPVEGELVANRVAALASGKLFEVASSDRHTVKPWFAGRVSVAPKVEDYANQGFALIGGRVDHVEGRSVPVLIYRHGKHTIDVTVLKPGILGATANGKDGFSIRRWSVGDLDYIAVSDTDPAELDSLAGLFQR